MLEKLKKELQNKADKQTAERLSGFFKTGKGEYAENDVFLGIKVPEQRKTAKKYKDLDLKDVQELLDSKIHEYRLTGLLVLLHKYEKSKKRELVDFYLKNTKNVNNWDLVDLTAPKILGDFLLENDRSVLYDLAESNNLWERRISIVSTFTFIKNNDFEDTLKIAEILLHDNHDLIHKSVGWMLREVGKRNQKIEEDFLKKYYKNMPRTMLRYAIEKFKESKRQKYLKNKI